MTNPAHRHLNEINQREHNEDYAAKKVISLPSTGAVIPDSITGKTVSYEDTSFIASDSPAVLNVQTDLSRKATSGYITNDGYGNILIEVSDNGTSYGGQHTLKRGETLVLEEIIISKIKLTHVLDSAYRALIY